MSMQIDVFTGPLYRADGGGDAPMRQTRLGALAVTDAHSRFYEQTTRGNMFVGGMVGTSIASATFTTADGLSATLATAATATPITGLWNPLSSKVNAVIVQATISMYLTALTATGPGALVWVAFNGQSANLTTALAPVSRSTYLPSGSQCKNLSGVALTGLQNTGIFLGASSITGTLLAVSELQTAAGFLTPAGNAVENVDGSIIVPPGGILALFGTVTPVACSAAASLLWEEVAI